MNMSIARRLLLLPTLALVTLASASWLEGYTLSGHKWGVTSVRYYVNPQNRWVSQSAAVSAIQTAAAGWGNQSDANIALVYAGYTSGTSLGMNYKNEVFFRGGSSSNVAEGYAWWDSSGKYVDGDLVFYEDAYQFFAASGCINGVYIENVGIHEFGHVLGLSHSSVANVTMQPRMQSYCDRTQLSLEADDIAGIEALYPPLAGATTNTAPSVSIVSPVSNSSFGDTSSITFSGSASDSQDGNVTSNLRWTSNLIGQIGTGGSFSRSLPIGIHIITAKATDSGGLSGSRQVTLTVSTTTSTPTVATLTARGYKVSGLQKADLVWKGITATSVAIRRNGTIIAKVPNTGTWTDPINLKVSALYKYKVCAAGTSTCTNVASVSF